MGQLFGTDGIRGTAGEAPLDDATVARLGGAVVEAIDIEHQGPVRVLLGRDTRESGPAIERALARGIRASGAEVVSAGVLPTPAVAYLTARMGFSAGIVISASHNPFQDNGIKVFSAAGVKVDDEVEAAVEAIMARGDSAGEPPADVPVRMADYRDEYIEHLRGILSGAPPVRRLADRARLREWRHDLCGAQAVRGAGNRDAGDRRRAGRPEHQSRLRLDGAGAAGVGGGRGRLRPRGSPMTATATAPFSWTRQAESWTVTRSSTYARSTCRPSTR